MPRLLRAFLPLLVLLLVVRPAFCPCFAWPLGCTDWIHDYRDSARDEGPFWLFIRVSAFLAQFVLVAGLHGRIVVFCATNAKAAREVCQRVFGKRETLSFSFFLAFLAIDGAYFVASLPVYRGVWPDPDARSYYWR